MDFTLKHLAKPIKLKGGEFDPNAKHAQTLNAIRHLAHASKDVTQKPESLTYVTKKTKLMLVILPEWSPFFPPFNLARLSAVAKHSGYQTRLLDVNVKAYREYIKDWLPNQKLSFRLWNPASSWRWVGENYMKHIHSIMEPVLQKAIDQIIEYNPDVVGFTQYYINQEPTDWMTQELKKRLPNLVVAVGGSNVQNGWHTPKPYYDYVVNGEGEEVILKILDDVETGNIPKNTLHIKQPEEQRLSINDLPMPDYTGIDFNDYEIPNGVNSELSRGCTAKCTFCEETHFYKYRQRAHNDIIKEIEHLYHERGTDVIWFIDSLVNGSLRELRSFCKGIIEKGLKISWTGYCRCDGRMDLAFYKDLAASGCVMLNYGIESGSQKVLDDMNKGVTIAEMEQNFRDGKEVGIWAATNWIIAFPTEQYQDFADTMTFLWRNRNMNINNIGAGVGYGLGLETIVGQNFGKFNILDHKYMGHWITKDFKLSGTHVMVRVKSFNIFLDQLVTEIPVSYPIRENLRKHHYRIEYDDPSIQNPIEYEQFEYNIVKTGKGPFADALVNEIWPLLRLLWKTRGGYTAKILFNPSIDLEEFGLQYGPGVYWATYDFTISAEGKWNASFDFEFVQKNPENDEREVERRGPFIAQDYSRIKSPSATRARRLAKPSWGEDGRSGQDFMDMLNEEKFLNQTIDFTFKFAWQGSGQWQANSKMVQKDNFVQDISAEKSLEASPF